MLAIITVINVGYLGQSGVFWLIVVFWLWCIPIFSTGETAVLLKLYLSFKVLFACWRRQSGDWFGIWLREVILVPLPMFWIPLMTFLTGGKRQW
jgi:hypothetical protein